MNEINMMLLPTGESRFEAFGTQGTTGEVMSSRAKRREGLIVSEQLKALSRRGFEEVWNQGKLEVIDELAAADCIYYDPTLPGGRVTGTALVKQSVQMYRAAFPDVHYTINDQISEGDKVVTRWTGTGTHTRALMSIAPTGKRVTVTGITISRYLSGKLVEVWENPDMLGLLQQIGVVPRLAPADPPA